MKKGALATGALAFGSLAGSNTAAAQDNGEALVFSYDYFPGSDFTVIAAVEQGTTVDVLQTIDEETVPEISQPDEWNGHVIRYDMGTETAGVTTFLFMRGSSMSAGDSGTLGEDASMFSSQLNLLSSSVSGGGGGGNGQSNGGADNETDSAADNETGA